MSFLILFKAWFKVGIVTMKRYAFDSLSGIVTLLIFFAFLFYGAKAIGGSRPGFDNTLSAIVVGYLVFTFSVMAFGTVTEQMSGQSSSGTLEQMAMSPLGLRRVALIMSSVEFIIQLGMSLVILVLMMTISGKWFALDLVSVVPVLAVTGVGILGVGFALGGVALAVKRMNALLNVLNLALIALVAVPISKVPLMKFLPLAWGNDLLRRVIVDDISIWRLPAGDLLFLVASSAVYLIVGMIIFRRFDLVARDRALLGQF